MVTILFSPMNKLWASLCPLVGMPIEQEAYREEFIAEVARCCSMNFLSMSAALSGFSPFSKNISVYDASFMLPKECVKGASKSILLTTFHVSKVKMSNFSNTG